MSTPAEVYANKDAYDVHDVQMANSEFDACSTVTTVADVDAQDHQVCAQEECAQVDLTETVDQNASSPAPVGANLICNDLGIGDADSRPAKRKKTHAMVSSKRHTIYAVVDVIGDTTEYKYIGSTTNENLRKTSLGVGAPKLKAWLQTAIANDPQWEWSDHIKILARNVPADRVNAFKAMFMSDFKTLWSEGNDKCNLHVKGVTDTENDFAAMRHELESGFATHQVTSMQAAETDVSIIADLDAQTCDEEGSIPNLHTALIERQRYLQALRGSPFEQAVKCMVDKYNKLGAGRVGHIPLKAFMAELNTLYDEHNAYQSSSDLEHSMHEEALAILKRLRVATGMDTTMPKHEFTYSFVHERLKLLVSAIKHRDNINAQSFQSQLAWTQPTFKLKSNRSPQGYEAAIRHAKKTLTECKDLTVWQKKQMKARLHLLEKMHRDNEPITSCPIVCA